MLGGARFAAAAAMLSNWVISTSRRTGRRAATWIATALPRLCPTRSTERCRFATYSYTASASVVSTCSDGLPSLAPKPR